MSAKADIYPNKNFGFRLKSRPVVAFGVKSKIFNLFGGAGGWPPGRGLFACAAMPCKNNRAAIVPKLVARVPRALIGGTYLILPPGLFWFLFWSQKRFAPGQKPFAPPQMPFPPARSHPPHTHHPKIFLIHPKIFLIYKKFAHCPGKTLVL